MFGSVYTLSCVSLHTAQINTFLIKVQLKFPSPPRPHRADI